ncbi:hypothetical protein JOD54_004531 [Actinokineospora baliensis]|uniref:hypothetical protein n=1 Tax=Actinokineospora baliensis TaxID=547056 RepID=UPI00195E29C0|nr:hypothetical protein [Actinokineospora baliensis]MBM7774327.1 hypothetical protein [Actinokineospora baliensis]
MSDIGKRIEAIVAERARLAPLVRADAQRWRAVLRSLLALGQQLEQQTGQEEPHAVRDRLVTEARGAAADVEALVESHERFAARLLRSTVNVGVSGSARVGKSTLLQSISGLADNEIPTGADIPVTAVRSRIFHSDTRSRALLTFHGYASLRDEVLAGYHRALGLPPAPATLEAFRAFPYPQRPEDLPGGEPSPTSVVLLRRLLDMREALPSYEDLLTGEEREIPLADLRPFIAYPTHEERTRPGHGDHRYLAVREARIECPFPHADVRHLGVLDLPGLGELMVGAEAHHVDGLRDEVDVVVMVVRASATTAYLRDSDARTLSLLQESLGAAGTSRDFVFILVNDVTADRSRLAALRHEIDSKINDGVPDQYFQVLQADAADSAAVAARVLGPLLAHLAERLPIMDARIRASVSESATELAARVETLARETTAHAERVRRSAGVVDEGLQDRVNALRGHLARDLTSLVADVAAKYATSEDSEYAEAVEAAYRGVLDWTEAGFGEGPDSWRARALDRCVEDHNSTPFLSEELNVLRVTITQRFAAMDDFLAARITDLYARVVAVLAARLGELVPSDTEPTKALRQLRELLVDPTEPSPSLAKAVEDLLEVRLDFRTQLYPRVRAALAECNLEVPGPSGQRRVQVIAPPTEQGVDRMYRAVVDIAEQTAFRTRQQLLGLALEPGQALRAVTEFFADAFIRSRDSKRDLLRLARGYRDRIWPDAFREHDLAVTTASALTAAAEAVVAAVAETRRTP